MLVSPASHTLFLIGGGEKVKVWSNSDTDFVLHCQQF